MIGLNLSAYVHKKQEKWGIIMTLLPLVIGAYSYILYFVIFSVFLKFQTPSQNVKFHIHLSHMEFGSLNFVLGSFCAWVIIKLD